MSSTLNQHLDMGFSRQKTEAMHFARTLQIDSLIFIDIIMYSSKIFERYQTRKKEVGIDLNGGNYRQQNIVFTTGETYHYRLEALRKTSP